MLATTFHSYFYRSKPNPVVLGFVLLTNLRFLCSFRLCYPRSVSQRLLEAFPARKPRAPVSPGLRALLDHGQLPHHREGCAKSKTIRNHFAGGSDFVRDIGVTGVTEGVTEGVTVAKRVPSYMFKPRAGGIQAVLKWCGYAA